MINLVTKFLPKKNWLLNFVNNIVCDSMVHARSTISPWLGSPAGAWSTTPLRHMSGSTPMRSTRSPWLGYASNQDYVNAEDACAHVSAPQVP
jgi:hypothetical protein